ncbi:hypothetical protein LCGC14_2238480 [marine sediment metagenome]|uniref:Uncharacterized protein n=2 Tax=marine sediment metagenome TaxID=412755 RepID=A0A0F9D5W2_9ZZZZ
MAGFEWAGSLTNSAPIKMVLPVGETMYVGQMAQWDFGNGLVGTACGVQIADVASSTHENDLAIAGIVRGVYSADRTYDGTYYGDKCTYSATQSVIADTGFPQVEVVLAIPHSTLFKAPIFDAAFGTALTEQVVTAADSGGVSITAANDSVADIADNLGTAYCRSGANRGLYRCITTSTSGTVNVVTVPFPNGIVAGDVFVLASVKLGMGGLEIPATANCIDGNNTMGDYRNVVYHEINLEESGKEYAVFSFTATAVATAS